MTLDSDQVEEFRGTLREISEAVGIVNGRLQTIDRRLQSYEDRTQRLETRLFAGPASPTETAGTANGPGNGEYFTLSAGKRVFLSLPKQVFNKGWKWMVVILLALATGNADRLWAIIKPSLIATTGP